MGMSAAEVLSRKKATNPRPKPVYSRSPKLNCKVKELRKSLGLTQQDVALAVGVTRPTVWAAERGWEITLTTALAVARFFGRPVEEIWSPLDG
jgi:DNA-binding XRE family transcriptional regulator